MTPTFFYLLIFFLCISGIGGFLFYRTWKKSRLVKCSYCESIMDQDDFDLHAKQHINSSDTKTKLLVFRKWVLEELSKENPKDEETLVKEGAIVCGLSVNTIRPVLRVLLDKIGKVGDEP